MLTHMAAAAYFQYCDSSSRVAVAAMVGPVAEVIEHAASRMNLRGQSSGVGCVTLIGSV